MAFAELWEKRVARMEGDLLESPYGAFVGIFRNRFLIKDLPYHEGEFARYLGVIPASFGANVEP